MPGDASTPAPSAPEVPLLVLGAGWVGAALVAATPGAIGTHRSPRPGDPGPVFALEREETWATLPAARDVVWTFPAAPPALAERFFDARLRSARSVIVLGSTSAYAPAAPDVWLDESAPLDLAEPRVAGEEALRARGATVLALAGLWGPGRDPVRWLQAGRIANGRKHVNLAHLDDVLAALAAALRTPQPGARINVCDGVPRRWSEHAAALVEAGRLPRGFALPEAPPDATSKRLGNARLRALLGPAHAFTPFTGSAP